MCGIKQRMIVFLSSYQESGIRAGLFTRESIERNIGPIYNPIPYYERPLPKITNHEWDNLRSIMDRKAAKEEKKRQEEICPECGRDKFFLSKKCSFCEDKEKKKETCPKCGRRKLILQKECSICESQEEGYFNRTLLAGNILIHYKKKSLL